MDRKWLFAGLMMTILVLSTLPSMVTTAGQRNAEQRLFDAFKAISEAEKAGGDASLLVADLNEAIETLERAETTGDVSLVEDAMARLDKVVASAPDVARAGAVAGQMRLLAITMSVGLLAITGFAGYRYVPVLFWRLWVRSKRNWRVRA